MGLERRTRRISKSDCIHRPGLASFYAARFIFAHLALCAAAIRFLPAAEIVRVGLVAWPPVFCFAQRAFCAKLIFLRADADIVRLPVATAFGLVPFM
jgi:hypothetical protein